MFEPTSVPPRNNSTKWPGILNYEIFASRIVVVHHATILEVLEFAFAHVGLSYQRLMEGDEILNLQSQYSAVESEGWHWTQCERGMGDNERVDYEYARRVPPMCLQPSILPKKAANQSEYTTGVSGFCSCHFALHQVLGQHVAIPNLIIAEAFKGFPYIFHRKLLNPGFDTLISG